MNRIVGRGSMAALLLIPAVLTTPVCAESTKALYKSGMASEQRGDLEAAYRDYSMALAKAPADIRYKLAFERVRSAAAIQRVRRGEQFDKQGRFKEALVEFFRALEIDPGNALASQDVDRTKREIDKENNSKSAEDGPSAEDLDKPGPPVHLDPFPTAIVTLHMAEDSRVLYATIGRIAGLSVLFDPDFVSKRVTMDMKDATPAEALRALGDLSNSFWKPSTHNTIYVAPDTRAKRTQLEQQAVRTLYLSNVSQQNDLNDVTTALRNVITNAKMYAVQGQNAIVVRGTPDEIMLAKQLVASLDLPKPEVLVDVYVMEVRRDKVRNIGISPPTSLRVTENSTTSTTSSSGSTTSSSPTLNQIGRSSSYSFTIGQAQAELLLTDSDTRVLQNPSIRAVDGQKATLKIGERIPYATGSYSTATSATTSAVQTQFQYVDVGVNIEMTPTIHDDRDVTMKLGIEVSSESGTSTIEGVSEPIISQEKADQVVRLKDGEVSILAGLVQDELTHSASGWPGLGEVPGLKYMFSAQSNEDLKDQLVFMLVPHVVREPESNAGTAREIDTGSSSTIRMQRIPPQSPQPPVKPVPSTSAN